MLTQILQGMINSWNILKTFLQQKETVISSNGWNLLPYKPQTKKINEYNNKKRWESKVEDPGTSTRKPQVSQTPQEGNNENKRSWKKQYSQKYRIPRIWRDSMENVLKISRTWR
ncbi:hypothetical protein O181_004971 [Austropuccinia psidii MF-1]|uniref:Uncharacterized protein n=1 Tax=Austropuccinia psidii MF-1 TaxID=1389203 RepID=A0A9Q3BGI0_9BASI|nr:hypothetical protein [Austropuccinia psidii MF-1]